MAIIHTNGSFTSTDTVTNTNLNSVADAATFNDPVDETTLELITTGADSGKLRVKANGVGTTQLAASSVTKAKIEDVADMKVLGNTSGAATAPEEVDVLDEDDMNSDSATALATQQSIKAYADAAPKAQMKADDVLGDSVGATTESVTLPNGLIMKFGQVTAVKDTNTTVTFNTAFSGTINAQLTVLENTGNDRFLLKVASLSNTELRIRNTVGANLTVFWQAIGY